MEPNESDTVQNVQDRKLMPYFEVAKDEEGKWHWCLWAANGKPLAQNVNPYGKRADCTEAIKAVQNALVAKRLRVLIAHGSE